MSALSLTYQDLSVESKKQTERMQKMDPKKAQQMERLGMGILAASSGGPRYSVFFLSRFPFLLFHSIPFLPSFLPCFRSFTNWRRLQLRFFF